MRNRNACAMVLVAATSISLFVTDPDSTRAQVPVGNGDVNADGFIDIADAIYIVMYRFRNGPEPVAIPCPPPPDPPTFPVTARASVKLSNQPGRAIASARENHFIVDSVPPLQGPNEEINPFDMILGALGTCGVFLAEAVAMEQDVPLSGIAARVEADFDPRGLLGGGINPRIQVFRVHLELPGADADQIEAILEGWRRRCPIYTTLVRSAPIEVTTGDETMSAPIEGLATGRASVELSNQSGRAIVSARGNHFVIDSVPVVGGPNEERNPLDLLLGALGSCGTFLFESAAREAGLALSAVTTGVEADFDPRGMTPSSEIDPRIQAFRVHLDLAGVDDDGAGALAEAYQERCPIFTTLIRAAPIEIAYTVSDE